MNNPIKSVEEYINQFPEDIQTILRNIRKIVLESAVEIQESISYGMPAYKLYGKPLVYFGAFSKHIGFYALPSGHQAFASELRKYKMGKGSVRFPINQDIPYELIQKMTAYRVNENRRN